MLTSYNFRICILIIFVFQCEAYKALKTASPVKRQQQHFDNQLPVVYTQYKRRLPAEHPDDEYVEEILEVFSHIRHKPPQHTYTDDDIDKIIRCDFDPTLNECGQLSKSKKSQGVATTPRMENRFFWPTQRTTTTATTKTTARSYAYDRPTAQTTTTTTIRPYVYERPTAQTTTTTTIRPYVYERSTPSTTTTTTPETNEFDTGRMPDLPDYEDTYDNQDGTDDDEYDDDDEGKEDEYNDEYGTEPNEIDK